MELLRFANIQLSNPTPARILRVDYGATVGTHVKVHRIKGAEESYDAASNATGFRVQISMMSAPPAFVSVAAHSAGLDAEFTDEGKKVRVPDLERARAEAAIEEFADLLAVAHQCERSISSPFTSIAVVPESPGEFGTASALELNRSPAGGYRILRELSASEIAPIMHGRTDGLRLLASALSDHSPQGRARWLYLLFEAAFGQAADKLTIPLHDFLSGSAYKMQFTRSETHQWTSRRRKAMHSDRDVATHHEFTPILDRMEWAAYDILLNKLDWGSLSTSRRNGAQIMSGPRGATTVLFSPEATGFIRFRDAFGSYPQDDRVSLRVDGEGVLTNLSGGEESDVANRPSG